MKSILVFGFLLALSGCAVGISNESHKKDSGTSQDDWDLTPKCLTSVSGIVYAPTPLFADPIYNAIVYIPNGPLAPMQHGAVCERCQDLVLNATTVTLSSATGAFKLENVPVGDNIPIVFQIGKWRRQVNIPHIERCQDLKLDREMTRLPRNKSEGEMPQIAIATGEADPMECVLHKIGIDDSEFTLPWEKGKVHLFQNNGEIYKADTPGGDLLYDYPKHLDTYDMVFLPCEGNPTYRSSTSTQNIIDYTSKGGKLFTTHYSYTWIEGAQEPFHSVADWTPNESSPGGVTAEIYTTFPKGKAFADWLWNVGASKTYGTLRVSDSKKDLNMVNPPTQPWMYSNVTDSVIHFTFNTPIGIPADQQCGRVVYSDFHVTGFCDTSQFLSPEEKAIEFMIFDLSSCVQSDTQIPTISIK